MGNFRQILTAAAVAVASISGTAALATTVTYSPDEFLFSANLGNSGEATEVGALQDWLIAHEGFTGELEFEEKVDSGLFYMDHGGNFYVDLVSGNEPGWFILKFGDGNTTGYSHYFFRNLAEFSRLVWTSGDIDGLLDACGLSDGDSSTIGDPCRLSHITTVVPLPAAGLMLISAIGGLRLVRRRRKSV